MASNMLSEDSSSEDGGAELMNGDFKVNEEFAKKFEHNKKREELQKLEAKHGNASKKRKRDEDEDSASEGDSESSSDSEEEDDAGELATESLDAELFATLKAIKSKDPRIYDPSSTFYTANDGKTIVPTADKKDTKPLYLKDYHRENLLKQTNGLHEEDVEQDVPPLTYDQKQSENKKAIVGEIKAAIGPENEQDANEEVEEDFLVTKERKEKPAPRTVLDLENAERDPETFLSNFMAARAWVPTSDSRFQAFESDDEEEERRAEEFEEAYNLRFEDPAKSNEKLRTHARDLVEKQSVRRKELNPRQKARLAEKEKRVEEKTIRKAEKARLRKLRVEELDERVRRIKRAAGMKFDDLQKKDFRKFIIDDWDEGKWERQMQKRFGDKYYEQQDVESETENKDGERKRKLEKPMFDDDIDIKDIIPDFEDDEKPEIKLTDDEVDDTEAGEPTKKKVSHKKKMEEKRKEAKKERRFVEQLVDEELQLEMNDAAPKASGFRYRETSPTSFGLDTRDILFADDSQLNQFAGLKKLAAFRDEEKKRKDKKHLGKKARLRKWRQETFGNEDGVQGSDIVPSKDTGDVAREVHDENGGVDIREGKRKKRHRAKKPKLTEVALDD